MALFRLTMQTSYNKQNQAQEEIYVMKMTPCSHCMPLPVIASALSVIATLIPVIASGAKQSLRLSFF
jgi:hypothetical protein